MNKQYDAVSVSRPGLPLWCSLLLICVTAGNTLAQTAADYSVHPPFYNLSQNMPSSSGSTVAAVDEFGRGAYTRRFIIPHIAMRNQARP